jgi:hypothetical protein
LRRLADLLGKSAELDPEDVDAQLRRDPGFAATALRRADPGRPAPGAVLVVDQFEELFTLGQAVPDRRLFIQALHAAAQSADTAAPAALVVLGVRADQYGRFADHPELTAALRHGQLMLGPMTRDELVAAIEQPAQATGLELDTGLRRSLT